MCLAGTRPMNGPNARPFRSWQDRAPEELFFPQIHESPKPRVPTAVNFPHFPVCDCALHRGPRIQSRFRTHGKNDMTPPSWCTARRVSHHIHGPSLLTVLLRSVTCRDFCLQTPNTKQPNTNNPSTEHWGIGNVIVIFGLRGFPLPTLSL